MLGTCITQRICSGILTALDVEVVPIDDDTVSPVGLALEHPLTLEPAQPLPMQQPQVREALAPVQGLTEDGLELFPRADLIQNSVLESLPEEEEDSVMESTPSRKSPNRQADAHAEPSPSNSIEPNPEAVYPRIGLLPRPAPEAAQAQTVAEEEEKLVVAPPPRRPKPSPKPKAPQPQPKAPEKEGSFRQAELRKSSSTLSTMPFGKKKPAEPAPMHLRPALKSRVTIDRGSAMARLGLDTTEFVTKEEGALRIEEIDSDGLLEQWNKAHSNREVMKGDYIVEVNGVRGSPRELLQAIVQDQIVDMLIKRVVQPRTPDFPGEGVPRSSLLRRWSSRVSTNSTSTTASGQSSRWSLQTVDDSSVSA